jgi:hypothetical protein
MTEEAITSADKRAVKPQRPGEEANPRRAPRASRRLIVASNRVSVDADKYDSGGLTVALPRARERARIRLDAAALYQ